MKKVKALFLNMLLLTATSLFMRTVGVSFQVYLSNKIGSAGIGLYQLTWCVFTFAITLATSGIKLTATRLISEELGLGHNTGAGKALKSCLQYSLFFSLLSACLLFAFSGFIGTHWLGDERTVLSLRILAVSLPFISLACVLNGYFTAVRRVIKSASTQTAEQLLRIALTVAFLTYLLPEGLEYSCAAVVLGSVIAEVFSFFVLMFLCLHDKRRYKNDSSVPQNIKKRMLCIALPLALSSYVRSGLSTAEHLLIPIGLKKSGTSSQQALTTYGTIHGMVMPIILFPSALLDVLAELLVPEITECQARGNALHMNYMITRVFQMGMLFSIGVTGVMFRFSHELGIVIYKTDTAGCYIRIFAPLIIIMYMDTLVDGMLKGLGAQVSSMRYNIIDALTGVILVYTLIPRFAIKGYILTIIITEFLNFILSARKLIKISDFKINVIPCIIKPVFCIISALAIANVIFRFMPARCAPLRVEIAFKIAVVIGIYFFYLYMFSCLTKEDTKWFLSLIK